MEDAEHAIVAMGSIVSTVRQFVDAERARGKKVGLVKLKTWRPFPGQELYAALKNVKFITVLDKNIVFGVGGALATDIKAAFYGNSDMIVNGCIIGLGGAKSGLEEIKQAVDNTEAGEQNNRSFWMGM